MTESDPITRLNAALEDWCQAFLKQNFTQLLDSLDRLLALVEAELESEGAQ